MSRSIIFAAVVERAKRRAYANVTVILITAPPEILVERLLARGRDSDGQIAHRLGRAYGSVGVTPDFTITNIGGAEDHARELVRIIRPD